MKISIVIPVYHVEAYIVRCLQSVATQTFRDIECLIVDDGGQDDSARLAHDFIQSYQGDISFQLLHHEKNSGLSAARNSGIRAASGDYIYFLDSDDAISANCIEVLAALAQKYPTACFIQGNFVTGSDELMPYCFKQKVPEFCDQQEGLQRLVLEELNATATNRLIKRSFIMDNHLLFPEGMIFEDMYWTYFLAGKVTAAAFTNEGTYLYYINQGSIMTSVSRRSYIKRYHAHMRALTDFFTDISQHPATNIYQHRYFASNLVSTLEDLVRLHSLRRWLSYWTFVFKVAIRFSRKISLYRFLLFLSLTPPLCFLAVFRGWVWRLKHYIVSPMS